MPVGAELVELALPREVQPDAPSMALTVGFSDGSLIVCELELAGISFSSVH